MAGAGRRRGPCRLAVRIDGRPFLTPYGPQARRCRGGCSPAVRVDGATLSAPWASLPGQPLPCPAPEVSQVERDGAAALVDVVSLALLKGSEIDFADELAAAEFRVKNPNAKSSCGCGVSFSI